MPQILKGSTDVTRYVMLRDSAAGTPETGYTITNLDLQYTRNRAEPSAKVDATALTDQDDAHADNQAIEIDGTSSPGLYRIDWPDAAFASGADKVILVVSGAGLDPAVEEIELVDFSLTGQSAIDLKDFADDGYDPSTNKVQGVVLVDTCTTNSDMRGTDNAATATELAKVPKSDGSVSWNATALGDINAQADTALSDYAPATAAKLVRYISALARKDAALFVDLATELGEINQNYGSGAGAYSSLFDSQENIRDSLVTLSSDVSTIDTVVDSILADTGTDGVVVASGSKTGYALTSGERDSIAAALLDLAAGVETNRTVRQALRIILASAAGKLSGAATSTVTIRDTNDSKDRITATVDADGNRSAVTLDGT